MLNKKALAASVSAPPAEFVEDVFSTYLYTGTGATQNIVNGIDLAGKGGLVWTKNRLLGNDHSLEDSQRGLGTTLRSSSTAAAASFSDMITAFNSNGYTLGADASTARVNADTYSYCSWTFREQPKFMDVVTYTGDGTTDRNVPHNLGSQPGMVIIKATSTTSDWNVRHVALGSSTIKLNTTAAAQNIFNPYNTDMTSTTFYATTISNPTYSSYATNNSGVTYVAYLFAHNAGGFGTTGTDNVISCGSFTIDGSGYCPVVNLGYEPQYLLAKSSSGGSNWIIVDTMRGFSQTNMLYLAAQSSGAEADYGNAIVPTATGFGPGSLAGFAAGSTFIYMAIRRPMKVPTTGTSVFSPATRTGTGATATVTGVGFAPDFLLNLQRDANGAFFWDKLRGGNLQLRSSSTAAETTGGAATTIAYTNDGYQLGADSYGGLNVSGATYSFCSFRRASGFMDVVCYTGTGTAGQTYNHNLNVVPELMIVKQRDSTNPWRVYSAPTLATTFLALNTNAATTTSSANWNDTAPTSSVFTVGTSSGVNASGGTYVNYLFATCAGVSKVGSYTGTGTTQTINCGFTAGARFVMVKATSTTGDWVVLDTARGIVSGNDPFLELNTTAAEQTGQDILDPDSSGFVVNQTTESINASGVSYIFLAIA
jgi:hypothetical protein